MHMILTLTVGLEFSETMSDDEFIAYLKQEGLQERDCSILTGHGKI